MAQAPQRPGGTPVQRVGITPKPTVAQTLKQRIRTAGLRVIAASRLSSLIGRRYRGRGVILMFHDFVRDPERTLGQGCRVPDFEAILHHLRRSGRDIVSLDDAMSRLAGGNPRPFAVLTFDDGYRSNRTLALPVLERHDAPATIYVPSGAMDRTLNAWWLGLTALFREHDTLDIAPMGVRFHCPTRQSKVAGLGRAIAWVWQDFRRAKAFAPVFAAHGISLEGLVDAEFMDAGEVRELDRHPLVEIAAHTRTHRALSLLARDDAREDIAGNKQDLEQLLQREVPHFAYPYGPPSITGTREASLLADIGFRTGVTTTPGCLFPDHLETPMLLPRQNAEYPDDAMANAVCGIEGVFRAIASRGGDPRVLPAEASR
jgi:peptidoglycan/xylan/chitin deacetylase (PgdA/CDA1 family)